MSLLIQNQNPNPAEDVWYVVQDSMHRLSARAQPIPPRKPLRRRLVGSQAFRTKHGAVNMAVDFLGLVAVLPRLRHAKFEFPDRRREFRVFLKLTFFSSLLVVVRGLDVCEAMRSFQWAAVGVWESAVSGASLRLR